MTPTIASSAVFISSSDAVISISGIAGPGNRQSRGIPSPSPSPALSLALSPPSVVPSPPSGGKISSVGSIVPPLDFLASTSTSYQRHDKSKNMRL